MKDEAIKIFESVLKRTRGSDVVAECLANFHLGIMLYKQGKEKERARAHLVEFQILSQMKEHRSRETDAKFKLASHAINEI